MVVGVKFCPKQPLHDGGESPLHRAALEGSGKAVKALLEAGADLNARTRLGGTPLHLAAMKGNSEVVKLLLNAGADPNARDHRFLGNTPLHWARYGKNGEVVKLLLEAGADPNARDKLARTPLHGAAGFGSSEMVKALLQAGADPDPRDKFNISPLHRATHQTNGEVVKLLLEAGAEVDARINDFPRRTPLHGAAETPKSAEVVKALLRGGADPNARDGNNLTALHLAAWQNDSVAVRALIQAGAELNARDREGLTPLHWVSRSGSSKDEVVTALLMAGADPYARDNEGNLASDWSGLISQFRQRGIYRRPRPSPPRPHSSPRSADQLRQPTEARKNRQRQPPPTTPQDLIEATGGPWPQLPAAAPKVHQRPQSVPSPLPEQDRKIHQEVKRGLKESGVTTTLPEPTDKRALPGEVTPPTVLSRIEPGYSEAARKANIEGTVELSAIVRKDGSVEAVKVSRGLGMGLDENAINALKSWRFRPGMKGGRPVDLRVKIEVTFSMRPEQD